MPISSTCDAGFLNPDLVSERFRTDHLDQGYEGTNETDQRLQNQVEELLRSAAPVDEDALYGKGKRRGEVPEELARLESWLKKIRVAKAEPGQEARTGKSAVAAVPARLVAGGALGPVHRRCYRV